MVPYMSNFQLPQPRDKRAARRNANKVIFGGCGGIVVMFLFIAIVGAVAGSHASKSATPPPASADTSTPPATGTATHKAKAKAKPKPKPKAKIVTFIVSGSAPAGVNNMYGSDSDNRQGPSSLPMRRTMKLDDSAMYYMIMAQLQGGGDITCEILINGKSVAHGHASGGYNICHAQANSGIFGF